jgi:hypothetical protein
MSQQDHAQASINKNEKAQKDSNAVEDQLNEFAGLRDTNNKWETPFELN